MTEPINNLLTLSTENVPKIIMPVLKKIKPEIKLKSNMLGELEDKEDYSLYSTLKTLLIYHSWRTTKTGYSIKIPKINGDLGINN